MKRIKLISTPITNTQAPEGFTLDYRREFLRLIEIVPEGGAITQMGLAIKLAAKLQAAETGHDLLLEGAEWEYLYARLRAAKFTLVAPEIAAMIEAVAQAEGTRSFCKSGWRKEVGMPLHQNCGRANSSCYVQFRIMCSKVGECALGLTLIVILLRIIRA